MHSALGREAEISQGRPAGATWRIGASATTALVIALGPLLWLGYTLRYASYAGLGRDQGARQGLAWAVAHGARLYSDLREIDGPLALELHLWAQRLGGTDARALRCLDLALSALVFLFVGASLPGATRAEPRRRPVHEQLLWGLAGCVLLLVQYLALYDASQLTQRESIFDWFVLGALGCILRELGSERARHAKLWLVLAGAASATPWFGKPLCVFYSLLHLWAFASVRSRAGLDLRQRLLAIASGLGLGSALQLGFLAVAGDVGAFLRIYLSENPLYYDSIWPHRFEDLLTPGRSQPGMQALFAALATVSLVATRRMGRQMLAFAAFPLLGLALDFAQGRSFGEHMHPVTAGTTLIALALCCQLATPQGVEHQAVSPVSLWSVAFGTLLAFRAATALLACSLMHSEWAAEQGGSREARASSGFARHYDTSDFAGAALVEAGAYLRQHTRPGDRIQLYGMDPYLLALAQRHSATPYVYAADLVPDASIAGIRLLGGSDAEVQRARALAARNAADFLARLYRANPAALVLFDHTPFRHPQHALDELLTNVPEVRPLLREKYRETHAFGLLHVYLRNDLAGPPPPPKRRTPRAR